MALNDVTAHVTDGLRAADPSGGSGVQVKLGVSQAEGIVTIRKGMTIDTVQQLLGRSPLADAAIVSLEMGASVIYCVPLAAAVAGTVGTVTHTGTGSGMISVTGNPSNALQIVVEITGKGGLNVAMLRYSLDGGVNYTGDITVPLSGELELTGTGLTLKFAAEGDAQYTIGDTYTVTTTAPAADNETVLTAIAALHELRHEYEYIHLVGAADPALWAAVSVAQQTLAAQHHKYAYLILEAPAQAEDETLAEYVARLETARRGIHNHNLQICATRCLYTRSDGLTLEISDAAIAAGQYSKAAPQESIGMVSKYAVPEDKRQASRPAGIDAYTQRLDAAGYLTYRQYDGIDGWYATNANMLAASGSNYAYAEDVRVVNKVLRLTRQQALQYLHKDLDPAKLDAELQTLAQYVAIPLEQMARSGEISSASVTVPADGQSISAPRLEARYVQRGVIRQIALDIGALGNT